MSSAAQRVKIQAVKEKYLNKPALRNALDQVERKYPSLQVTTDMFVDGETGRMMELLCLHGTVPVSHRGALYNIPLRVWLPLRFPEEPPLPFVCPTPDMLLAPNHSNVALDGSVTSPLQWGASSAALVNLLDALVTSFGVKPPVYAKPPSAASSSPAASPSSASAGGGTSTRPASGSVSSPSSSSSSSSSSSASSSAASAAAAAAAASTAARSELQHQVRANLEFFRQQAQQELDQRLQQQSELTHRAQTLEAALSSLQAYQDRLHAEIDDTNRLLQALQAAPPPSHLLLTEDIDANSLVVGADAASEQLLRAVADDLAMDDALYALDARLKEERVDMDSYLRQVRQLARRQFLARALSLKIAQTRQMQLMQQRMGAGAPGFGAATF